MRLLIIALICSLQAQGQTILGDSLSCYSRPELFSIASKLADGQECDTLLKITLLQSLKKDTIITKDSIQINNLTQMSLTKDNLFYGKLLVKDEEIKGLKADNTKLTIGGIGLLVLLVFSILK